MADVKISGLPASTVPLAGTEVLPIVQGGATKQVSIANVTAGRAIAATSITTDTYKAASSSGGVLQNSSGAAQLQWGSGGGNNLSVDVAININPANAAVAISPTGTGTVAISPAGALTINPTAASTINNTSIGATTASTGRFTSVTATTGNVVIGTSGQGVDFSATPGTGTSELLADYEEGTWTPAALFSTSNGDLTYAKQVGRYIKVGSLVTVTGWLNFTETTASGNLSVTGLPFTSANITDLSAGGGLPTLNMTLLVGGGFWSINPNSTVINVFQGRTGDIGAITNANTDAGAGFYFSCSYQAA
jgi:hypothetical protein